MSEEGPRRRSEQRSLQSQGLLALFLIPPQGAAWHRHNGLIELKLFVIVFPGGKREFTLGNRLSEVKPLNWLQFALKALRRVYFQHPIQPASLKDLVDRGLEVDQN